MNKHSEPAQKQNRDPQTEVPLPMEGLLDTLNLLVTQARTYELILPADNYPARAAVAVLGELARKAVNEAQAFAETLAPPGAAEHPFTPREFQVLKLAAHGLTNKEIAHRLVISERTIQFHINSIFNKTSTRTRTEAVALAIRKNWLAQEGE